jgi:AraC-like DNA-binding protein
MPQQKIIRLVTTNDRGCRIGESHHRSKWSNDEIDRLLNLRDEGWSYTRLSREFGMNRAHVRDICKGKKRCQTPEHWKRVVCLIDG